MTSGRTALLIQPRELDAIGIARVRQIIDEQDITWEALRDLTATEPLPAFTIPGPDLLLVALVDETCGGGCAWVGYQGVEIMSVLAGAEDYMAYLTHEMVHNFDRFSSFLYNSGDWAHSFTAFLDRYARIYQRRSEFRLNADDLLEQTVRERLGPFETYPGSNWQVCVVDRVCDPPGGVDANELAVLAEGGVLLRAAQLHGPEAMRRWAPMVTQLIAERALDASLMSREQKVDLMQESIGRAFRQNTSCYFDYWRWPVSGLVRGPLEQLYGQNPNCQDGDRDGVTEIARDCNDVNAAVSPRANETVNGVDNDCDGIVDDVRFVESGDFAPSLLVPTEANVRGTVVSVDDYDDFRIHVGAATPVRFTVSSPSTYAGWFIVEGPQGDWVGLTFVGPGGRNVLKLDLAPGEYRFTVTGSEVPGPYQVTVQRDYPLTAAPDFWPVSFTPQPATTSAASPNLYRLPLPAVPASLAGRPGLTSRFWVSDFAFVGSASAGTTTPFNWLAPEGTNPLELAYRVEFMVNDVPVHPLSQHVSLLGARPWSARDVGAVGQPGTFTRFGEADLGVRGSGADIGGTADGFQLTSQPLSGDGEVIARIVSLEPVNPGARVGVMIRESFAAGARNAMTGLDASGVLAFQRRSATNGATTRTSGAQVTLPYWVRVTRQGSTLTSYQSSDGKLWTRMGGVTMTLPSSIVAGVAVTAHDNTLLAGASVDHVVVRPLQQALFVVGNTTLGAGDAAVRSRLEALGYAVVIRGDAAATSADASGKALVVVSSTVTAANVNTKFRGVSVPVVCWESSLYDDLGMTGAIAGTDFGTAAGQTQLTVANASHPLAAGLSGTVAVATAGSVFSWGRPNANAADAATLSGNVARSGGFGYARGAAMVGLTAPAKRVGLFLENTTATVLTTQGWALFEAAIAWASTP